MNKVDAPEVHNVDSFEQPRGGGIRQALNWRLAGLVLAGFLLEVAIVWMSKGATVRTWPDAIRTPTPIAGIYGVTVLGMARFGLTVTAMFAAYGLALYLSRIRPTPAVLVVAFCFPVAFACPLWIMYPAGSQDMMHNVFDAVLVWQYRVNPLLTPPMVYADHPLFSTLSVWEDQSSYYGPLWYLLLGPTNWIGGNDFVTNLLVQKALIALFFFATGLLVYLVAVRLSPTAGIPAFVTFAWNPLVLFETVGNGHNDVIMLFFGMVSFLCCSYRRWAIAIVALCLAVLVKFVVIVLGPLLIVYALHVDGIRSIRPLLLGALIAVAVAILAFFPFFEGWDTFLIIYGESQEGFINSPTAVLHTGLGKVIPWGQAAATTKAISLVLFSALYLFLIWRQGRAPESLMGTSFYVLFGFLLIMTWWFWPWYVVWIVPFSAVALGSNSALLAFVLSFTAMLGYIPKGWESVFGTGYYQPLAVEFVRASVIWAAPALIWSTLPLHWLRINVRNA